MKEINGYRFLKDELKEIEKISVLDNGEILIYYEITLEFQIKNDLLYKHRILKINPINSDLPRFESYANIEY